MQIINPPLRTVRLYGQLGSKFGRVHRFALDTNTPSEAVQALCAQVKGFREYLTNAKDRGVGFSIFAGRQNLGEEQISHPVGDQDIRIAPMILGSKNGGVFQIILGVVLLAVAYFIPVTAPYLIPLAVGMIAGGVVSLLTPIPKGLAAADSPDNTPSYTFNGPLNTEAQGHPVPLLYGGPMKVGSAVISAGIDTLDTSYAPGGQAPGNGSMGGGGGCVSVNAFVHVVRGASVWPIRARDVHVGDILLGADPVTLEQMQHEVTYSEAKWQPCVEIEAANGAKLPCSRSAPIPTAGGLVLAPDLDECAVAVHDGAFGGWSDILHITDIGMHWVQHIAMSDGCFYAGKTAHQSILHHNKLASIDTQEGR